MRKIVLLTLFSIFSLANSVNAELATGQTAPIFTLQDFHGKMQSLSDYRGKYVVLEWWNSDCPFVQKQYNSKNMQNLQKVYTEKGVIWFSINSSVSGKQGNYPAEEIVRLISEKGAVPTTVLLDSDGTVGHMYGAQTTPHMFIINPLGELIYQGAIDSVPSVDPADIATAVNYVSQALEEAMAGQPVSVSLTKSYGCSVKYE